MNKTAETKPVARVITLTGRAPVHIRDAEWPTIAAAVGDSWTGRKDYVRHQLALAHKELDTYTLRVRKHSDGRVLIYGILIAADGQGKDRRGGLLLEKAPAELATFIKVVARDCCLPEFIVRECIANLPPQEL